MSDVQIGESFVGDGVHAAHINTVLGARSGVVGAAWASALATPTVGHAPFVAVLRPNVPVKPMTLFVNKAAPANDTHSSLTWGAAQAGVASGVADAVAEGAIAPDLVDEFVLIAAVWVNPDAVDADQVFENNRTATRQALVAGRLCTPPLQDVLDARATPVNPFYRRTT